MKKKKIFGKFQNVELTSEEYKRLINNFGENRTKEKIDFLSERIASYNHEYKSYYETIFSHFESILIWHIWHRGNEKKHDIKSAKHLFRKYKKKQLRDVTYTVFESDIVRSFVIPDLLVIDEIGNHYRSEFEKMYLKLMKKDHVSKARKLFENGRVKEGMAMLKIHENSCLWCSSAPQSSVWILENDRLKPPLKGRCLSCLKRA